jgi:hypothetical protein
MFQVFDVYGIEEPAELHFCKDDASWNKCRNSVFSTFDEAENYAISWLGCYAPKKGILQLNVIFDDGHGDFVVIRKFLGERPE